MLKNGEMYQKKRDVIRKMKGIWDIHCHILPGVDDGAEDMETAKTLIRKEMEDGVGHIILTPHYRRRMFEPEMQTILETYEMLREETWDWPVELYLGCEYHANMDMADDLNAGKRPALADSRYVLCEFSDGDTAAYITERTYQLLANGYIPVLAHIERYKALSKDFALIDDLAERGCKMQVNAGSILGEDGFFVKRFCKKLIDYDLLHFVGSDAHNLKDRTPRMGECAAFLQKKYGEKYARQILQHNPEKILEN